MRRHWLSLETFLDYTTTSLLARGGLWETVPRGSVGFVGGDFFVERLDDFAVALHDRLALDFEGRGQ